jgi:hypothetical protein
MLSSSPPSILFVGWNSGIEMEGWAAVGMALTSKRNLKKLNLGEQIENASTSDRDRHSA